MTARTDSDWCLVGNIVEWRSSNKHGTERGRGTKHFSPGTKVYCLPAQWGDGYEKIKVVGRHRGSHQYVTMVVQSDWVTNWRAKVVYSPEVLRRLRDAGWTWKGQEEVARYVEELTKREGDRLSRAGPKWWQFWRWFSAPR